MEGTQDRPRKKIPLNTACWDCYRSHRGCDGLRPCKRCVDLRRGASCRDPAPDERILRKRKRFNSKDASKGAFTVTSQQGFIMDPRIFLSPITRVIKTETCISPPSSTFAFDPSVQPTSPPDREFNCESEDLEPTNSRRFTPQQQLILDQPHTCSYLSRRQPTQITMIYVPPSVEALIEEICVETEETADHRKTTTSVFQSLSVPDDMLHLTESFFTPFGLRDSTQPFIVFKLAYVDQRLLAQALQEPNDMECVSPIQGFFVLSASPSFCVITKFAEEELLGLNCTKMVPHPLPWPAEARPILPYLCPQPSIRVSPIFRTQPLFHMKTKFVMRAEATMQYFYASDGTISFVVLGVERFAISENTDHLPQPRAAISEWL